MSPNANLTWHAARAGRRTSTTITHPMLLALALLAGCGGGGGADAPLPSVQSSGANTGGTGLPPPGTGGGSGGTGNTTPPPEPPPPPPPPSGPEVKGAWTGLLNWPQVGVHLQLLPNGNVLSWAYRYDDHDDTNTSKQVFEVSIPPGANPGTIKLVTNNNTNLACSGFTLLADGRLLAAGGEGSDGGLPNTNLYDYRTGTWTRVGDMNGKRWYPTTTTLPNGDVLAVGGLIDFATSTVNAVPQVWSTTAGWRNLTNAVADDVGIYPRMHLAPNGRVFKSGMQVMTRYLDTADSGAWTNVGMLNHRAGRDYGSSVLYGDGRVIAMGGGDPPTNTAEIIDLRDASPAWRWTAPMAYARRHLNATLLADGQVLVVGGTSSPGFNDATRAALPAEMWNPETGKWTTMASMNVPRVYHSTALLLPDGRVLAAGGGDPAPVGGGDNVNAEIYSPPYLFKGARPTITSAPTMVAYGAQFTVRTPDAADIAKAHFIRLGSVTHAFDNSQRISALPVTKTSTGVNLIAPTDPNLTPPGHYMLFLLNSQGVPSIARIVQIL